MNEPNERDKVQQHPNEMLITIRGRRVVAVLSASIKGNVLATHWILTTNVNNIEVEQGTESN